MTIKLSESESEHALLIAAALPNGAAGNATTQWPAGVARGWLRTMRSLEKRVTLSKARDYYRADATDEGRNMLNRKGP